MRTAVLTAPIAAALLLATPAAAQTSADPSTEHGPTGATARTAETLEPDADTRASLAREQLKRGFALRKAGQCNEALSHLFESLRLSPQPKTLLNLADCEERLGLFVEAQGHWGQASDLARSQGDAAIQREALVRLAELAPRVPDLTIVLAASAPSASRVQRDGVDMASSSLGMAVPCNPGVHTIEVHSEGYTPKSFEVVLRERESARVEVAPGPRKPRQLADLTPEPVTSLHESPGPVAQIGGHSEVQDGSPTMVLVHPSPAPSSAMTPDALHSNRAILSAGLVSGSLGLASLALGVIEGLAAERDHRSALAACGGNCSSMSAQDDQSSALKAATVANVGFVAGGTLAAASVALIIVALAPSSSTRTAPGAVPKGLSPPVVVPVAGENVRGVGVEGAW